MPSAWPMMSVMGILQQLSSVASGSRYEEDCPQEEVKSLALLAADDTTLWQIA